jgi:lipopolysaccharide/colanic/teichoic acid biosynthesis glycosyltransferase
MLQEQSRLFQRVLFFADAMLVALSWVAAYVVRFEVFPAIGIFPPPEAVPLWVYLEFVPWVLIVSMTVFWATGLYDHDRAERLSSLVFAVAKSILFGLVIVVASLSLYRTFNFSRLHMGIFGLIAPLLMGLLRIVVYQGLRRARQNGKYLKRVLIIGAGKTGQKLYQSFEEYPWMGFETVGFLDDDRSDRPDVLGGVDDLVSIIDEAEKLDKRIDYVYIALPLSAAERIREILIAAETSLTHVCLVPDLEQYDLLNGRVTVFSVLALVLLSPFLLLIALVVKMSSSGPVLYKQERMGLNGQKFNMLKFRSMPVDAEATTGAVWSKAGESRATPVGSFLRRTSLDELPQFVNVLKGDMSVVGPRPERPVFIDQFRTQVPQYMLRHKMKAGITGWAQVNGWRGSTSLEKRIEFDIYYIRNWSLGLDLKIMLLTVWKGFVSENAH